MLDDALAYPRRGDSVLQRHVIGGAFLLFSFLLLPIFLVYGYLVAVVRGLVEGDPDPPEWTDWEELFVDGLKYFVIQLVYGIPVAILGGLISAFAVGAALGVVTDSMGTSIAFAIAAGLLGLLAGLVGLVTAYLLPGAVVNFVLEDDLMAAFRVRTIASNAVNGSYFVAWLLTIGVGIVLGLLGAILLPFLLVGLLVFFYLAVVATHLLTSGYLEAADATAGAGTAD